MPGPRNDLPEVRLALSNEALKMNGMPSARVISFSRPATSWQSASLSTTQGPAIRKNGRSRPTSKPTVHGRVTSSRGRPFRRAATAAAPHGARARRGRNR